eukprot:TRINITY_DN10372_c0_g1_i2.p1 TRINITY_DN10372_c0_g1~~TRINITY_DN10372_c0_g1_i2.p1  ORF type:complete len:452 (+),score=118.82 TRINITY_DN10372_c0_g1_i2:96-1451(+)
MDACSAPRSSCNGASVVGIRSTAARSSLVVSRVMGRVMARPGLREAADVWDARLKQSSSSWGAPCDADAGGSSSSTSPAFLPPERAKDLGPRPEAVQKLAKETCRSVFLVCLCAAGAQAQLLTQLLLAEAYRRAGRRRLDEDEMLLQLVHRFSAPSEWARSALCCRRLRDLLALRSLRSSWQQTPDDAGAGAGEDLDDPVVVRRGLPLSSQSSLVEYWLRGYSPQGHEKVLRLVIQHGLVGLLRPLVAAGGNINCVDSQYWFRTPLHRVASRGHRLLCRLLLELRADASLRDSHGAAPIHLVASKGQQAILEMLLEHDAAAATRAVDNSGRTPLHMAALKGHPEVVQTLLAARASAVAQASDRSTPLDMAHRGDHVEIIKMLEQARREELSGTQSIPAARIVLDELVRRATEGVLGQQQLQQLQQQQRQQEESQQLPQDEEAATSPQEQQS